MSKKNSKTGNGRKPEGGLNNLVAKHAHEFNKAHTFRDRTKYRRSNKHKNKGSEGPFYLAVDKYLSDYSYTL